MNLPCFCLYALLNFLKNSANKKAEFSKSLKTLLKILQKTREIKANITYKIIINFFDLL